MNITDTAALARGAMVVDFAFSHGGSRLWLEVGEYVGVVAACLNRGIDPEDIEKELSKRAGPTIGQRAKETFDYFNHFHGNRLWSQGPATDDIRLTDKKLAAMFPKVNEINDRMMADLSNPRPADRSF